MVSVRPWRGQNTTPSTQIPNVGELLQKKNSGWSLFCFVKNKHFLVCSCSFLSSNDFFILIFGYSQVNRREHRLNFFFKISNLTWSQHFDIFLNYFFLCKVLFCPSFKSLRILVTFFSFSPSPNGNVLFPQRNMCAFFYAGKGEHPEYASPTSWPPTDAAGKKHSDHGCARQCLFCGCFVGSNPNAITASDFGASRLNHLKIPTSQSDCLFQHLFSSSSFFPLDLQRGPRSPSHSFALCASAALTQIKPRGWSTAETLRLSLWLPNIPELAQTKGLTPAVLGPSVAAFSVPSMYAEAPGHLEACGMDG